MRKTTKETIAIFLFVIISLFVFNVAKNRIIKKIQCESGVVISCPDATKRNPICNGVSAFDMVQLADKLCAAPQTQKEDTKAINTSTATLSEQDKKVWDEEITRIAKLSYDTLMEDLEKTTTSLFYVAPATRVKDLSELAVKKIRSGNQKDGILIAISGYLIGIFGKEYYTDQITCPTTTPTMKKELRDAAQINNLFTAKTKKLLDTIFSLDGDQAQRYVGTLIIKEAELMKKKYRETTTLVCHR